MYYLFPSLINTGKISSTGLFLVNNYGYRSKQNANDGNDDSKKIKNKGVCPACIGIMIIHTASSTL